MNSLFQTIYSWIYKPPIPPNPDFKDVTIIYNFLDNKREYIEKCTPIIDTMRKELLIEKLYDVNVGTMDVFRTRFNLNKDEFTDYDMLHVNYSHPLLCNILNKRPIEETDLQLKMLTKVVCKNYIIKPKPTDVKVMCDINVENMGQIKVNCYDIDKDNIHYFKSPKGSIEKNETVGDALLREMKEEVGFTFPIDRYSLIHQNNTFLKYKLDMTEAEYEKWKTTVNFANLDPEITHIVLTKN